MSSISSSSLEQQLEQILDLLTDKKSITDICAELKMNKQKILQRINKLGLLMVDRDMEIEKIIEVTNISESKLNHLITERNLKNRYNKNATLEKMMKDINKKQSEIMDLQHRIIGMLNDNWKY